MSAPAFVPRLVAWEITRSCNLFCAHCRASATSGPYEGELTTQECLSLVDGIRHAGNPIMILTGGEPLLRPDFFDIAAGAAARGLRVVAGSNGTLITRQVAARMKAVPLARIGVSIEFPTRERQDSFRGVSGAFDAALDGIRHARDAGIEIQINSTITRLNAPFLEDLLALAMELGAAAFHPFMLVPTGRGKDLEDQALPAAEYERILGWIYDKQIELGDRMFFKPTDAPHYMRIAMQKGRGAARSPHGPQGHGHGGHPGTDTMTRGCLAGTGFCFVSHTGRVQGCGYLDVEAGDLRRQTFQEVWQESPLFNQLRDFSNIKGKCGACEYLKVCGGCRARAYEATGDYLAQEPYCLHQPSRAARPAAGGTG